MHSKRKGNIGELRVAYELNKLGYSVFRELGDISRIDLIVQIKDSLLKIQVKYITRKDGCYVFSTGKSGPGYRYNYRISDVDVFALYCAEDDVIAWVLASDLIKEGDARVAIKLRSTLFPSRNNQFKGIRSLNDVKDFNQVFASYIETPK